MATKTRLTLEEFLALPETEPPSEYICGEVVQKVAPSWNHGVLVLEIGAMLRDYLRKSGEGFVNSELRHAARAEQRAYLPDVNVTLQERAPRARELRRRGPIEVPPDFAIEVLSPDDNASRVLEKVDFYIRNGVRLVWLVDPDLETITVYRPGEAPRTHRALEVIDAAPVLRDFHLSLADLFAALHAGEEE